MTNDAQRKRELDDFFSYCAERMRKENNASDFLYSLLKSSKIMRSIFSTLLDYPISDNLIIKREWTEEESRPDFFFFDGNVKKILVEVKFHDTDYHIRKYSKFSGRKYLLLIDNPIIEIDKKKWTIIKWEDLIKGMEMSKDSLIKSSAKYFRKVTKIEPYSAVKNITKLDGLRDLNRMTRDVIDKYVSPHNMIYKIEDSFTSGESGYYYSVRGNKKDDIKARLFFGAVYNQHWTCFMLYFERSDNNKYFDQFKRKLQSKCSPKSIHIYPTPEKISENDCVIKMAEKKEKLFFKRHAIKSQKQILKNFLYPLNNIIEEILNPK